MSILIEYISIQIIYIHFKFRCCKFECLILGVARGFLGCEQFDHAEGQGDQLLYLSHPLVMHRCSTAVRKASFALDHARTCLVTNLSMA